MERYLEEQDIPSDLIRKVIRKATIGCNIQPVTCGTAFKNKGVQTMLDAVVEFLPSPLEVPAIKGVTPGGDTEVERPADVEAPFSSLAFKIMTDPHVGKLAFFRVYSGKLDKGSQITNARTGNKERMGRILEMHANSREDVDAVYTGDIMAAIGIKDVRTGDSLGALDKPIVLEAMTFPDPVIDVAVEPKSKADQEKLSKALMALSEEDPTFRVHTDFDTGQTILSGMGELHLEVLVDRMLREFKVDASVGMSKNQGVVRTSAASSTLHPISTRAAADGSRLPVRLRMAQMPTTPLSATAAAET